VPELIERLGPIHAALFAARGRRKRPLVDDKVLADWNGLMIAGLARSGRALQEPAFVQAAARAASFVLDRLVDAGGSGLLHVYRNGTPRIPAFLDDYAFLVQGLLELHAATAEARWLREAVRVQGWQDERLWDASAGGYFNAGSDPELLVRSKAAHDGATASGNGVAALSLLRLSGLTGNAGYADRARAVLLAFGRGIDEHPLAHVSLVRAVAPSDPLAATAASVVKVEGRLQGEGPRRGFVLELDVSEGWHLNANPATLPFLVPTSVGAGAGALHAVRYPEGEVLAPAPGAEALSVYRGRVRIEGELDVAGIEAPSVRLTYQACDSLRCLPPVTREVALATRG
jgi:hypothetical protein